MTQVQLPGASINLALRQVKMEVWWSTGQVKLQCEYSLVMDNFHSKTISKLNAAR